MYNCNRRNPYNMIVYCAISTSLSPSETGVTIRIFVGARVACGISGSGFTEAAREGAAETFALADKLFDSFVFAFPDVDREPEGSLGKATAPDNPCFSFSAAA